MSNTALDLEPKGGDYVKYIDQIQTGKVKELAGVRAGIVTQSDSGMVQVKSGREVLLEEEQIAQKIVRKNIEHTRFVMGLIGPVILICGILFFALGVTYEMEDIIPIGMVLMFVGFVASAKLRDKIKESR
jgi:hypothetical protein